MGGRRDLYRILLGLSIGLTIGWLAWSDYAPNIRSWANSLRNGDEILVLVVGNQESVKTIHHSVPANRILAHADSGLAIAPKRLVVESLESLGEILTLAGWTDRPLKIVDIERLPPEKNLADENLARTNALMNKPTLTQGEARFLLNSM